MIFKRKTKGEGRHTIYIHTHVRAGAWAGKAGKMYMGESACRQPCAGIRTDGFKPDITCKKPHSSGLVITTTKKPAPQPPQYINYQQLEQAQQPPLQPTNGHNINNKKIRYTIVYLPGNRKKKGRGAERKRKSRGRNIKKGKTKRIIRLRKTDDAFGVNK